MSDVWEPQEIHPSELPGLLRSLGKFGRLNATESNACHMAADELEDLEQAPTSDPRTIGMLSAICFVLSVLLAFQGLVAYTLYWQHEEIAAQVRELEWQRPRKMMLWPPLKPVEIVEPVEPNLHVAPRPAEEP